MSGKYQVVHSNVTTVATTQDVTASAGFGDVCCVMFYYTGATQNIITRPNIMSGCGASDFTRQWVGVGYTEDNVAQTNCVTFGSTASCIMFPNSAGTALDFGATVSQITDGIRLDWGQTPSIDYKFSTIFFGGDSLRFEVGSRISESTVLDGSHVTTFSDMTVEPEVIIFQMNGKNAYSTTPTADHEISWGFCSVSAGEIRQATYGFGDDDDRNAGGRHGAFAGNQRVMKLGAYAGTRTGYELVEVGVNGTPRGTFTLAKRDIAGTQTYGYVALSWEGAGNYHATSTNLGVASIGLTSPNISPGFRGQFLLSFGSNLQTNNVNNTAALGGVGGVQIVDSVNDIEGAHQWSSDEVDPSQAQAMFQPRIVDMRGDDGIIVYQSAWQGFTDTSWEINVTTPSNNNKRWLVLVLGFEEDVEPAAGVPLMWGRAF